MLIFVVYDISKHPHQDRPLMGRGWPPTRTDLAEAQNICRALELGLPLDRMPGGLQQLVGETDRQLSHGEKSRLPKVDIREDISTGGDGPDGQQPEPTCSVCGHFLTRPV